MAQEIHLDIVLLCRNALGKGHYKDVLALAPFDVERVEGNPTVRGIPEDVKAIAASSQPSSPDTIDPVSLILTRPMFGRKVSGQGIVVAGADTGFAGP